MNNAIPTFFSLAILVAVAGCSKQEQKQAETQISKAGDTTVKVLEKAGKATVKTLDKAADLTGDAAVTGAVKSRLLADKWVGATNVDVSTKNNVVLLLGSVPSEKQRLRAAQIAGQTSGVKKVVNRLRIAKA